MTELGENWRFIYRAVGSTDAALLSHSQLRELGDLLLGVPESCEKGACGAIVLPPRGELSLSNLLGIVKSEFIDLRLGFPQLIIPPGDNSGDLLQDIRDYCLVYDFVEQVRGLSLYTGKDKLQDPRGISLSPVSGSELPPSLVDELAGELSSDMYFTPGFWRALFLEAVQGVSFQWAQVDGEDAGLAVMSAGPVEFRLLGLYTRLPFRAKGVGRKLLGCFLETARNAGAPLVSVSYAAKGVCGHYVGKFGFQPALEWTVQVPPSPDFFAPA